MHDTPETVWAVILAPVDKWKVKKMVRLLFSVLRWNNVTSEWLTTCKKKRIVFRLRFLLLRNSLWSYQYYTSISCLFIEFGEWTVRKTDQLLWYVSTKILEKNVYYQSQHKKGYCVQLWHLYMTFVQQVQAYVNYQNLKTTTFWWTFNKNHALLDWLVPLQVPVSWSKAGHLTNWW